MTTRQVREGRQVRLVDPLRIAARFHRPGIGIAGAGGVIVERWLLDTPATIMATADARRRVLVGWPTASRDGELIAGAHAGLWLDVEHIEAAG